MYIYTKTGLKMDVICLGVDEVLINKSDRALSRLTEIFDIYICIFNSAVVNSLLLFSLFSYLYRPVDSNGSV